MGAVEWPAGHVQATGGRSNHTPGNDARVRTAGVQKDEQIKHKGSWFAPQMPDDQLAAGGRPNLSSHSVRSMQLFPLEQYVPTIHKFQVNASQGNAMC